MWEKKHNFFLKTLQTKNFVSSPDIYKSATEKVLKHNIVHYTMNNKT